MKFSHCCQLLCEFDKRLSIVCRWSEECCADEAAERVIVSTDDEIFEAASQHLTLLVKSRDASQQIVYQNKNPFDTECWSNLEKRNHRSAFEFDPFANSIGTIDSLKTSLCVSERSKSRSDAVVPELRVDVFDVSTEHLIVYDLITAIERRWNISSGIVSWFVQRLNIG